MATGIEWCDSTWNPVKGCTRVSEGCRHCYAESMAARIVRMGKGQPTAYDGLVAIRPRRQMKVDAITGEPTGEFRSRGTRAYWTGKVAFDAGKLADPLRWKKPRRVFVNSMSDLFHDGFTNEQIAAVFGVMAAAQRHIFIVLTKRPKRMREWFEWVTEYGHEVMAVEAAMKLARGQADRRKLEDYNRSVLGHSAWPLPNVILGVSVENRAAIDRLDDLRACPASVRLVSAEPLLEDLGAVNLRGIGWLIAGCESGPGARPCEVDWLRSLRDQCAAAEVPFFLKQARETRLGGCTAEGSELGAGVPLGEGEGSKRKPGGIIGTPYLDGLKHDALPEMKK